jgi:hypothetical protein
MKPIYKLYGVVSVAFISAFVILIAFIPEPFLDFFAEAQQVIVKGFPLVEIFQNLEGMALIYAYLATAYVANLAINLVMMLLAYLSENKFYFHLMLYAFAINVIYFVAVVYTARLLLETAAKPLSLFTRKAS